MKFVLELFVEHIPAFFQKDLRQYYIEGYKKYINIGECEIYCSSRRLIFIVKQFNDYVSGECIILKGPRANLERDSIPVIKFYENANKIEQQLSKELYIENEYWYVKVQKIDMNVKDYFISSFIKMFEEYLPENRMTWYVGQKQMFVRPVRNVLAMLDNECIEFEIFNLRAMNTTKTNNYKEIYVEHVEQYLELLHSEGIVVQEDDRVRYLEKYIQMNMKIGKSRSEILDVKQRKLLDIVANHDENIYPFTIEIDYKQYEYMNKLPVEFVYASLDDQMQTFPMYDEVRNIYDEYRIKYLIFSSNIPVTEQIAKSTFKVCMSYLSDVYDLYRADLDKTFDVMELKNLPTYKNGNMYDRMQRMMTVMDICGYINRNNWNEMVQWLNVDLLSKTVQEFPKLHGACGAFVLREKVNNEALKALYNYYICSIDSQQAIKRLFEFGGYYGYEEIDAKDVNVELFELFQKKINVNEQMFAGMFLYWIDIIDTLLGFYIADGEQKIGSKDPFGLKSMIYNIKYLGLMLYVYSKNVGMNFVDLKDVIEFIYDKYAEQGLCRLNKEYVLKNVMRVFNNDIAKYICNNKSYWEKCENMLAIDNVVKKHKDDFVLICKVYKRIVNFIKQYNDMREIVINTSDIVSVRMMDCVKNNVNMEILINISAELDKFFDANRILDNEVQSRMCVLRLLQSMYEQYACFDDKLIDVYNDKTLEIILL